MQQDNVSADLLRGPFTYRLWFVAALCFATLHVGAATTTQIRQVPETVNIPLSFIANAGQFDPVVQFYWQDGTSNLRIGAGQITLSATSTTQGDPAASRVTLDFVDSNPAVEVTGKDPQRGVANFYLGNDSKKWVSGVPTYGAVVQNELYPGIAQMYQHVDNQLKSEFHVAPGADPSKIRMRYSGAESLTIDEHGELVIQASVGAWRESAPEVYQLIGTQRLDVPSEFQLLGENQVGFKLGDYDPTHALVIDPTLFFSTYLGGSDGDGGNSIAVDGDGNILVLGGTTSNDFPLENPAFSTNAGNIDMFVAKLDPTGSMLLYSTYIGGSNREIGIDIAVDSDNNAYGVGWTSSSSFPTTGGVFQPTFSGAGDDAAVFKLDPSGALVYSTFLGGGGDDQPEDIAVDGAGYAYVVGNSSSSTYPTTSGAYSETVQGVWDVFVTKLNLNASALVYSTFIGGSGYDEPMALAIDIAGNAYVTGRTQSPDYPIQDVAGAGVYDSVYDGTDTAFLTKLNTTGTDLVYSTFLDGISPRFGSRQLDVAVDSDTFAYVAAPSEDIGFTATPGTFDTTFNGVIDIVVMKVETDGSALVYSTFLGGTGDDRVNGIAVDNDGNAHVTGSTTSNDFPLQDPFSTSLNGIRDVFVSRLSPDGDALQFSTYLGGSDNDSANGITLTPRGPCITGVTVSTDFPTLAPAPFSPVQPSFGGGSNDAIITCIDAPSGSEPCVHPPAGMAYWAPFDETLGMTAADLVAGNNGTHTGLAVPTSGMVNAAIDLDGGHVTVPHANDLNFSTEDFTIDFWIREPDSLPIGAVVAKHDISSNQGFEVYWDICLCSPGFAQLFIDLNGRSHALNLFAYGDELLPWTHVVIAIDRDDELIYFYVNGFPQGAVPLAIAPGTSVDNQEPLLIGEAVRTFAGFSGVLDELELFRRTLTAIEAKELYAAGSHGKCKDGFHVGWDAKLCEDPDHVVVSVEICNYSTTLQNYELTFAPLPSGPGCSVAGPTDFEDAVTGLAPPISVMVPPQACVPVPVRIGRPVDMVSHNQTGCYQVIRRNLATGGTRIIAGSVQDNRNLCPLPLPAELEVNFSQDVLVFPLGGTSEVTFPLGNRSATEISIDYSIEATPSDPDDPSSVLRLDGGELGAAVFGTTIVPPLSSVDVVVDVENVGVEPFAFYDIVISTAPTGSAGPTKFVPLSSAGIRLPVLENVVANPDWTSTPENGVKVISVAANDVAFIHTLDFSRTQVLLGPFNGTAQANPDGTLTYTPGSGFSGGDGLVYETCDTQGFCDTAAVSIIVTSNDATSSVLFVGGFERGNTSAWSNTMP